ncbi:MAG: rod shape-determining protein RodA [Pseudomonadales bacterium]|jgi:rod shape determining protein RodA|nr:rod shape-determining protein RodA [Pseudomonadales bacterium]MCC6530106.1 rod shape-determining protein RodA [Pseudomonadales bacterium]MCP5333061.1 rod shape-determining protein RodA [Pseudomonadales bacterium]HMU90593.1 rod shape-determining protein RodA [Pseudomonadales bacterium]HMW14125.1 rod shape-determining protein RodA [Pseudomonadales bacterium]
MSQSDFVRRLPGLGELRQGKPWLKRLHIDPLLLLPLLLLAGYGLVVLYSAGGGSLDAIERQGMSLGLAGVLMLIAAQIDVAILRRWALVIHLGGTVLLIIVLLAGDDAKGATRWIDLQVLRFQPAEIMKLAMPLAVCRYLGDHHLPPTLPTVAVSMALIAVPTLLIAKQPDLGSALLIASSGLYALFLAGIRWLWIALAGLAGVLLAPALWFLLRDYQRRRILTLIDPEADPLGSSWNIIQSKIAIGSGGLHGKGWLAGTQSHLDFLPESHTDFIFAVLAEEFGLVGVLLLFGLYLIIVARGLWIAAKAPDLFQRLLAGSITLTFSVYALVNVGMVSGVLPVVGVPLPLISQGGTALVTLMLGFGVLMSIQTRTP